MIKAKRPEECNELLSKAFNARDIEMVMSLFEKDAIFTDQKGKQHIGLQAIREAEQKVIDMKPDFHIETLGVSVYQDIALLRSKWHLKSTSDEGEMIELAHNGIEVVRRQSDGSWLYIIDNPFYAD